MKISRLKLASKGIIKSYVLDYNKMIQRPSLWLIDLKTDARIRRFEIPETIVKEGHGMVSLIVDVGKDKCDEAYAYIADYLNQKIYVYRFVCLIATKWHQNQWKFFLFQKL